MNFSLKMESHYYSPRSILDIDSDINNDGEADLANEPNDKFPQFIRYLFSSTIILLTLFSILIVVHLIRKGQKTRSPQQRRPYMGGRGRPSLTQQEPTIYVSPANLPPPPKYEAMAPPSYEEVVGIHYPGYQPPVQPITTPINAAMAQTTLPVTDNTSSSSSGNNSNETTGNAPQTVITVTADNRPAATAATS